MGPVNAHYLLQTLYNHEMGFLDINESANSPLAVIRAFDNEDPSRGSIMDDLLFRYYQNKIYDRLKMSFLEYAKLPMPTARYLDGAMERVIAPIEKKIEEARAAALNAGMSNTK